MLRVFLILFVVSGFVIPNILDAYAQALERVPIQSPRLVSGLGNPISQNVNVNQQIQITADVTNRGDDTQSFVYILQIRDEGNRIISLAWITGMLLPDQSLSPALSWIPTYSGNFKAEIFVWESIVNPDALSKPESITITVS